MYQPQNICDAFHGGGEDWEIIDVYRRIESRLLQAIDGTLCVSPEEDAYCDALSLVRRLRHELQN
jgi:hypothetical protein